MPPESLESHDTDEMEMSEDEEIASQLRYGKRFRNDIKVFPTFHFLAVSNLNRFGSFFPYFHRMLVTGKSQT